jgi:hypothetical protein
VDEDGSPDQALMVDKLGQRVELFWGESCNLADTDYAVYRGTFSTADPGSNTFNNHGPIVAEDSCSTNHQTEFDYIETSGASFYYLVVPNNGTWEGSYGQDSEGAQRQQGSSGSCYIQQMGECTP